MRKTDRYRIEDRGYETSCWVWQLFIGPNGYGRLGLDGSRKLAHRHYYELHRGSIPAGKQLDHLCGQRACVNADHLEPVTNQENARRGRKTKLTPLLVREIRTLLSLGAQRYEVAERFGLTKQHVGAIERRQVWADV